MLSLATVSIAVRGSASPNEGSLRPISLHVDAQQRHEETVIADFFFLQATEHEMHALRLSGF